MCCGKAGKVVNGVKNIAKGYMFLASGVNQELSKKRMAICHNCVHFKGGLMCENCGCNMAAKTTLPEAECPISKWMAV